MINFYHHSQFFNQVEFGQMTIYYSFKMPFAYKTDLHGLRIRKDAFDGKWGEETKNHIDILLLSNNEYLLSEKEVFKFNIDDQFKRTIFKMAKNFAKKGLGLC